MFYINTFHIHFYRYTVHVVELSQLIHQLMHLYNSYTLKH